MGFDGSGTEWVMRNELSNREQSCNFNSSGYADRASAELGESMNSAAWRASAAFLREIRGVDWGTSDTE